MTPNGILVAIGLIVSFLFASFYYFLNKKDFYHAYWLLSLSIFFISFILFSYCRNEKIQKGSKSKTPIYAGELTPGNAPTPSIPVPGELPDNYVFLFLGNSFTISETPMEKYVIMIHDMSIISLKVINGLLNITTTLTDNKNHYILKIIDNEFKINQEYAFNPKQPDEHSLVVRDMDGIEIFNIRFLNPKAIKISGIFHIEGYSRPLIINPDGSIILPNGFQFDRVGALPPAKGLFYLK